ncbi:MAG: hypothetical protein J6J04_06370 [Oscillospiraceae bacterium]|nr:hypothetical protein [Oscillospiraceae bacterium]
MICPFYRTDDGKNSITCEGVTDDSVVIQRYRNHALQIQQLDVFCMDHYNNCEITRMLMQKYAD